MRVKLIAFITVLLMFITATAFVNNVSQLNATVVQFEIFINGEEEKFELPVVVINDKTYLPLRELCKKLRINVDWVGEKKRIMIDDFDKDKGNTPNIESNCSIEVFYSEGIFTNNNWDSLDFPIIIDAVPDKNVAINIANAIFKSIQDSGKFPDYTLTGVIYDTKDDLWIIAYSEDNDENGACFSIALQRSDAKVIGMWVGE